MTNQSTIGDVIKNLCTLSAKLDHLILNGPKTEPNDVLATPSFVKESLSQVTYTSDVDCLLRKILIDTPNLLFTETGALIPAAAAAMKKANFAIKTVKSSDTVGNSAVFIKTSVGMICVYLDSEFSVLMVKCALGEFEVQAEDKLVTTWWKRLLKKLF